MTGKEVTEMNIFIAIDSFKGSLSSLQAGQAAKEGILRVYPHAQVQISPIADGGEGTVEALIAGLGGTCRQLTVQDPLGRPVSCQYGILPDRTAVIEMSCAAGITLLTAQERNPLHTTTYGVGQVIADATRQGCRDFLIGIGGSATNDGGIGMLQALGFDLLDKEGRPVPYGAKGLEVLSSISGERALPELSSCRFRIACDVTNPLCGKSGCSAVYGPQKGADPAMIEAMDGWLKQYGRLVQAQFPHADPEFPGAGAAGGIGFAFLSFLGGELISGIDLILSHTKVEEKIRQADLVITGEGRLDSQTVNGKAPIGIASIAKKYGLPVLAFSGCITPETRICNQSGIDAYFPVVKGACSLEDAMNTDNAYANLTDTAEQAFRLLSVSKKLSCL